MSKTDWFNNALKKSVYKENGCLEFNGAKTYKGYGTIRISNTEVNLLHRMSYRKSNGEIPDGLVVRHTCDNPSCWNPDHLILGTQKDNSQDMVNRERSTKNKTFNFGSNHKKSKLTENIVLKIKALIKAGISNKDIATKFNISRPVISHIKHERLWKHVPNG